MSEPGKAVFISYASQDAEAVGRIAAALRTTGLEVWFDKDELRGGDAWDQKIRRQIKECALFIPVISANTQARPEGYFRLEWKLAVDRSHLMADDQPFLLPVIIDDTPEPAARVPDRFRDVQWTRLVLTETPAVFAERAKHLLGGKWEPGQGAGQRSEAGAQRKAGASVLWTKVVPAVGILIGLFYATMPLWKSRRPPRSKPEAPTQAVVSAPLPEAPQQEVSEARKLMVRAKALYELWDGATRDDFAVAEKLLKLAVDKDPADGEVWAAYGLMGCGQYFLGLDRSAARAEQARDAAERAVRLAPDSIQARFAQAYSYRFNPETVGEAEKILRELVVQAPDDRLIIRTLGALLRGTRKYDEALALFDRAAALPGGDPVAEHNKFVTLMGALRLAEAEAVVDAALAKRPTPYLYKDKVQVLVRMHGDLDGAAEVLKKVPAPFLLDDSGAYWASQLWLWRREPDKCIRVWAQIHRDLIETTDYNGPKAFIVGQAHAIAGRKAAAETEWLAALRVVEQMHAAQPNALPWVYWKARIYAVLDRRAEAEAALKTFEQLLGTKGVNDNVVPLYLFLGRKSEVLDVLEKSNAQLRKSGDPLLLAYYLNNLRFNYEWDALRDDPRFEKLLEK